MTPLPLTNMKESAEATHPVVTDPALSFFPTPLRGKGYLRGISWLGTFIEGFCVAARISTTEKAFKIIYSLRNTGINDPSLRNPTGDWLQRVEGCFTEVNGKSNMAED
ncbi:hypothetical protein ARMSODRAFT_982041 [Armillaria solidipes]|uniref:Uncharacterized protein n=1 Tax=Armillaria solidipes TaxID=1076256 RepID=A0A2H3B161_9AGAR|nr:hypothetical protein ARMSODRAFT_982041 [Armillaria solidipes]